MLRPFALSDLPLIEEAAGDSYIPLITTLPAPYTPGAGRAFIERQWGRAADGTGYSFAIADAVSVRAVGQAGLWVLCPLMAISGGALTFWSPRWVSLECRS